MPDKNPSLAKIFLAFDPGRTGKISWREILKGLAYGTLEGMELSGHFKLESQAQAYKRLLEFRKQDVEIYATSQRLEQENEEMAHQIAVLNKLLELPSDIEENDEEQELARKMRQEWKDMVRDPQRASSAHP